MYVYNSSLFTCCFKLLMMYHKLSTTDTCGCHFIGKLYVFNKNHALIKHSLHQVPEIEHHDLTLANEHMSLELMGYIVCRKPVTRPSQNTPSPVQREG